MSEILLKAEGTSLKLINYNNIVSTQVKYDTCMFELNSDWEGFTKTAVFYANGGNKKYVILDNTNICVIPWEVLSSPGILYIGIFGTKDDVILPTNFVATRIIGGSHEEGTISEPPTADVYAQIIAIMEKQKVDAKIATEQAGIATTKAEEALVSEGKAKTSETNAKVSEENAKISETHAKTSENNSSNSASISQQAMADFLALIGKDIATLTNGKLTPSQIPALSINDVFPVTTTGEMQTLTAQRGDVALIVNNDVVTDSYILSTDDSSVLANWKKLGVSYVAEAGHSVSSTTAENSNQINGHRLVTMTQAQYDVAVKEPETIYLVG